MERIKKWSYLANFSLNQKNKTTFFSSTLKVEENKVVLFFHFELKWARYDHFFDFKILIWNPKVVKNKNGYISLIIARNEKIRPLYFLQLLKFEKRKWSYFVILSSSERDTAIFLCFSAFDFKNDNFEIEKVDISCSFKLKMKK